MPNFAVLFFLALLARNHSLRDISCRDPDVGGTAQNRERKFLIIGSEEAGGAGIGNLLIFFPAAFYFAAFTKRDIIIADGSVIGEMCKIVTCGFPFVSQLKLAYPNLLNEGSLSRVPDIKAQNFNQYIEESKEINEVVVRAGGYQPKSDWWVWYNTTTHCVSKLTGCDLGDVMCAERHAFQRLIRGPFKSSLTESEEQRITGVPDHIKHAILTLPHAYAPRLDVAIHIRRQFNHFESHSDADNPQFVQEVEEWLQSSEAKSVFGALQDCLIEKYKELRTMPTGAGEAEEEGAERKEGEEGEETGEIEPIYVYLAADNKDVKDHFLKLISENEELKEKVQVLRVDSKVIYHVKQLSRLKEKTNNEGLLDLVFDWYALSLANTILAWRKGSTGMISTFVHSAQKVSGTTDRSDNGSGRGIGTRGFQLTTNRHGGMKFDLFWAYTFVEDYQI